MAEAVIGGALVAVLQDLVGFVDFLEADFELVAGIAVRMPFHRELAERGLELAVVRGAFDVEDFVVAALWPSVKPAPSSSRRSVVAETYMQPSA